MRHRRLGRVRDLQTHGSQRRDGRRQLGDDVRRGDVQDCGVEDLTVVVHVLNDQTIAEGLDVQLLQQGSLGLADLVAVLDELDTRDHFNLTLVDLGGDVQGLEPRRLAGIATRRPGLDVHIDGGDGADTRRGGDLVGHDDVAHGGQIGVGEDEAGVANDVRGQRSARVVLVVAQEVLDDLSREAARPIRTHSTACEQQGARAL